MTTQQKIEAIRAAYIVANPEIVELKFGCVTTLGIIVGAWRDVVEQKQKYVLNPVRVMESTRLATEDELEEITDIR